MVTSQVIRMVIVLTEISLYPFAFPEQTPKPGGTPKSGGTPIGGKDPNRKKTCVFNWTFTLCMVTSATIRLTIKF